MEILHAKGLVEPLKAYLAAGKPFLGICLGMQLLFEGSEESPGVEGLGVIPGQVTHSIDRYIPLLNPPVLFVDVGAVWIEALAGTRSCSSRMFCCLASAKWRHRESRKGGVCVLLLFRLCQLSPQLQLVPRFGVSTASKPQQGVQ